MTGWDIKTDTERERLLGDAESYRERGGASSILNTVSSNQ